jgi:hypothetical protein
LEEGAMPPLPPHPMGKEAFTAFTVLDPVIRLNDADDRIVKTVDIIQESVSKMCGNSLKCFIFLEIMA